jgi:hypothetical protein
MTYKGWAFSELGRHDEGIALMRDASPAMLRQATVSHRVHARGTESRVGEGQAVGRGVCDDCETLNVAAETGEAYFTPELYRLKGEFLRRSIAEHPESERASRLAMADESIREALERARVQGRKKSSSSERR